MELHGGGHSTRAFIHIKDVVRATLKLALEGEPGSSWHLSTQESCSIRNLVQQICTLADASFQDIVQSSEERLGKDQSYLLDSSAMRQVHSWSDQISLKEGLQETLDWVDANLATLKKLPWSYQHKL
jgi:dTDP-glucose 4,6-dehydratase